jgi:hypothetical protein
VDGPTLDRGRHPTARFRTQPIEGREVVVAEKVPAAPVPEKRKGGEAR